MRIAPNAPTLTPGEWLGNAHGVQRLGLDQFINKVVEQCIEVEAYRDIDAFEPDDIRRALLRECFYLLSAVNQSMGHFDPAGLDAIRASHDGKCMIPTLRESICDLFGIPNPFHPKPTHAQNPPEGSPSDSA